MKGQRAKEMENMKECEQLMRNLEEQERSREKFIG